MVETTTVELLCDL